MLICTRGKERDGLIEPKGKESDMRITRGRVSRLPSRKFSREKKEQDKKERKRTREKVSVRVRRLVRDSTNPFKE